MLNEFYQEIGGDYADIAKRIPDDEMILRFLAKFRQDESYQNLKAALSNEDYTAAFFAVHTLKGVAQNLSFSKLSKVASELTEALRDHPAPPPEALVLAVDREYAAVHSAMELL